MKGRFRRTRRDQQCLAVTVETRVGWEESSGNPPVMLHFDSGQYRNGTARIEMTADEARALSKRLMQHADDVLLVTRKERDEV